MEEKKRITALIRKCIHIKQGKINYCKEMSRLKYEDNKCGLFIRSFHSFTIIHFMDYCYFRNLTKRAIYGRN